MAKNSFFPEDSNKPSSVREVQYIYYSCESAEEKNGISQEKDELAKRCSSEDNESNTRGKWMLFLDSSTELEGRGITLLDYAWQLMKSLVDDHENSGIISVGSTTANDGGRPRYINPDKGVIVCFTKDYRDKRGVKRAADAIRKVFYYPRYMYYKTKIAADAGMYGCLGQENVSIYEHSLENEMYERNTNNMWIPVTYKD